MGEGAGGSLRGRRGLVVVIFAAACMLVFVGWFVASRGDDDTTATPEPTGARASTYDNALVLAGDTWGDPAQVKPPEFGPEVGEYLAGDGALIVEFHRAVSVAFADGTCDEIADAADVVGPPEEIVDVGSQAPSDDVAGLLASEPVAVGRALQGCDWSDPAGTPDSVRLAELAFQWLMVEHVMERAGIDQ